MNSIRVWGDSIGKSIMYDNALNRHIICRDNYENYLKGQGVDVRNFSRMGLTAPEGLKLMTEERMNGDIAVIEFGGNDSDIDWRAVSAEPDHKGYFPAKVSLAAFRDALAAMIKTAREHGMKPVIVTPLPVIAECYFKWISKGLNAENILKYLGTPEFIYRWQERYDMAARETAIKMGAYLLDMRLAFLGVKNLNDIMSEDGIHPNGAGHALIKNTVIDALAAL